MRKLISHGLKRLTRTESRYTRGTRDAVVIAVATVKGGVGKTTTSVNLASALAQHGRVLLIDLDAQGHCSTSLSAKLPADPVATPLSRVLLSDDKLQVLDSRVTSQITDLDVTPADSGLAEAEGLMGQKIGKELLLRDALTITRTHYDFIVVDCPPNKGNLTLNALLAADHVLVPTDLSPLAIQGADELLGAVATVNDRLGHPLNLLGIVLTRVDGRNVTMNASIRETIADAWGELVFDTEIGVNTALAKAQHAGEPIFTYDDRSRGAKHYTDLTVEVLGRLGFAPEHRGAAE